jgi:hypothetical protein
MLRLGGTASPGHITVFRGLKTHFQQQGIALDWVLYADYDALVEAFATREIDLAWNGPISYVHIKQRLHDPCRVVAMRDVDVNFRTQLFTRRDSSITTLDDLKGKRVALGSRGSAQAGLLPYYFLKQHGLDPQRDLAAYTFAEDREPSPLSDERADTVGHVWTRRRCQGEITRATSWYRCSHVFGLSMQVTSVLPALMKSALPLLINLPALQDLTNTRVWGSRSDLSRHHG